MLLHKSLEFDSRVQREASALASAGHRLTVLELAPVPAGLAVAAAGQAAGSGFARRSVLPAAALRRLPFHVYRFICLVSFVRAIVRLRPQVVHAHDAAMLPPGALGAWLTGARLVYDSHELATGVPYRDRPWRWFISAVEVALVPRCAAVITVSDGIAARLRQRYRLAHTPTVVRNVSALEHGGAGGLRERLGLAADAPLVLHQGAPARARGCEVLIEAVALMPEVNLVFLGDPDPGYALAPEIRRRGISDRVTLLPSVPLADLLSYTAEADVGVTLLQDICENHRLALPNKLFEYIAAGVPVVASALPEMRRLVESYGVGWCVAPSNPRELAAALGRALESRDDPQLRDRLAHARGELRWSRERARLDAIYTELADSGR